ncbi:hypothetical protein HDU79_000070 [Rhizoclosmatium sp. JEL0117]|nr:hypothetical protein HDU79_000070 [Rhizoclosmatium sp. JEL0117]
MRFSFVVVAASVASSVVASVSLHLSPAPITNGPLEPATVSWSDLTSVLAHANGVSRLFRWSDNAAQDGDEDQHSLSNILASEHVLALKPDLFHQSSGSLVMLVAGLETNEVPLPVSFTSTSHTPLSAASDYLNHFIELISSEYGTGRANMISVSSVCNDNILSIPGVSRLVLKKEAAVATIPDSATTSLKSKLKEISKSSYVNVKQTFEKRFGKTVLKESENVDKMFMVEMNFVDALSDALGKDSKAMLQPHVQGFLSDYFSVSMTRLNNIYEVYGKESAQFQSSAKVLKEVVSKVIDTFHNLYPEGQVQIIALAPSSSSVSKRDIAIPDLDRRLAVVNPACPLYFQDCMTLNSNCSNHGTCTQMRNPRNSNQTCFFCSCYTNNTDDNGELIIGGSHRKVLWAGPQCAKQDISADFHLLLWTTVGLTVVMIFVVGLLASVGSEESNAQGAGAGKKKED